MNEFEIRWKACFASILSVSPYPILVAVTVSVQDNSWRYFSLMALLGLPVYFIYSLLGWIFIGMPINRVLVKYPDLGLALNLVSSTTLCFLLHLVCEDATGTVFFGVPIMIQPVAFWLYFRRYTALSPSRAST